MRRRKMNIETRAVVLRRYAARPGRVTRNRRALTGLRLRKKFLVRT
jgi:hypothetical protein